MKTKLTDYTRQEIEGLDGRELDWCVRLAKGVAGLTLEPGQTIIDLREDPPPPIDALALLQEMCASCVVDVRMNSYKPGGEIFVTCQDGFAEYSSFVTECHKSAAVVIKRAYCMWKLRQEKRCSDATSCREAPEGR